MVVLELFLGVVCFLHLNQQQLVTAQTTQASDNNPQPPITNEDNSFSLLWYHWVAIIVIFAVVIIILSPTTVCLVHYCRKNYALTLANRYGQMVSPTGEEQTQDYEMTSRKDLTRKMVKNLPKRKARDEVDTAKVNDFFKDTDDDCHKEIERNDINYIDRLGIGEFGAIFDAEVKLGPNNVQRAMVKVFEQGTSQDLVRFREEIENLQCLDHPQVAKLFGVVSRAPYYVVTELTINGDLKSFLLTSEEKVDDDGNLVVPASKLVAMATDVASGLSYLECMNYVHKDIAARNCLVTEDLGVKIADFKVGRYLSRSEYAVQPDGSLMPIRWMAPETLMDNKFTLESNVWSFGVLLWEVMSRGAFPYSTFSDEEVVSGVCHGKQVLLHPGKECPERVYKVMLECWSFNPYERPHMALAHQLLESCIMTSKYAQSHVRLYS